MSQEMNAEDFRTYMKHHRISDAKIAHIIETTNTDLIFEATIATKREASFVNGWVSGWKARVTAELFGEDR